MKKIIKMSIAILAILIISNWCSGFINFFVGKGWHSFETFDKKYTFWYNSHKGGNVKLLQCRFRTFSLQHPEYEDTKLYRTFSRQPLFFWNWYDYFTAEKYKFPYRKASENSVNANTMIHIKGKETICLFFRNNSTEKYKSKDKKGNTIIVDKYKKEVIKLPNKDSVIFYVCGECFVVEESPKIDTCSTSCVNLKDKEIKSVKEMQRFRELMDDTESYINNPYKKIYLIEIVNNEQCVMYPVKWKY